MGSAAVFFGSNVVPIPGDLESASSQKLWSQGLEGFNAMTEHHPLVACVWRDWGEWLYRIRGFTRLPYSERASRWSVILNPADSAAWFKLYTLRWKRLSSGRRDPAWRAEATSLLRSVDWVLSKVVAGVVPREHRGLRDEIASSLE